jgi:hypothetical protein
MPAAGLQKVSSYAEAPSCSQGKHDKLHAAILALGATHQQQFDHV